MSDAKLFASQCSALQRQDLVFSFAIAMIALVVGSLCISSRPDLFHNDDFLILGEAGNALYRADLIGQGKIFYAEIASQYGVLGSYLFAVVCSLMGVSGYALAFHNVLFSSLALGLLFLAARTVTTRFVALLYIGTIAGWVFVYPITPFGIGAYGHIEYISVEKLLVVLVCLVAALPQRWIHSLATGCVLGLMQTNKFGLAIYVGLGIAICEVIFWFVSNRQEPIASVAKRAALTCLGFLAIQIPYATSLYLLLPRDVALESIWPTWILESYPANRDWITFENLLGASVTEYLTQRLVIFTALLLTIALVIRIVMNAAKHNSERGQMQRSTIILLAPGVCFFIGFGTFLAHEHLVFHYSWLFAIAAVPAYSLISDEWRKAILFVPLPAAALVVKVFCFNAVCQTVGAPLLNSSFPLYSRNGVTALLAEKFKGDGHDLVENDFVVYVNLSTGGGFHYYFSKNFPLRAYIADKPYIRPYDINPFLSKIKNVRGVLIHASRMANLERMALFDDAFPEPIAQAFASRAVKSIAKWNDVFVFIEFEKD